MQQFDNEFFMTFTKAASRLYVWHIFIKKTPCMGGFVLYSFEKGFLFFNIPPFRVIIENINWSDFERFE